MLQSLGFCAVGLEVSGSLPCHPRRLGLPHPGKLGRGNLDFSLGSISLNSPQDFISIWPTLTRVGCPAGEGPSIPGAKPSSPSPAWERWTAFGWRHDPLPTPQKLAWLATGRWGGRQGFEHAPHHLGRGGGWQGWAVKHGEVAVSWGVALVSWCKMPGPHIALSCQWEMERGKGTSLPFKIQPGSYPQSVGSHPIGYV